MDIYQANHPGASLDSSEVSDLVAPGTMPFAFISRTEVASLISPADSVGIRFYEINSSDGILASNVKGDGFDTGRYHLAGSPEDLEDIIQVGTIEAGDNINDEPLTVFFSNTMLENCLGNTADGISLYLVELGKVADKHLSRPELRAMKMALRSYLAVPTVLMNNKTTHPPLAPTQTTGPMILSDLPCPGYCLAAKLVHLVGPLPTVDGLDQLELSPYLRPWD